MAAAPGLPVMPGAEPYAADPSGDTARVGVLLSHGFTGTTASMRPWAEYLAAAGYTVRLPRLPGHGTTWQDMSRTTWPEWYAEIERAYADLAGRCERVFAGGLSMGGTLVTRLAEQVGEALSGLVLVNPSFGPDRGDVRFARFLWPVVPYRSAIGSDIKMPDGTELSYDRTPVRAVASLYRFWSVVQGDLPQVRAPILMYRSVDDHVVGPRSGEILRRGAVGTTVEEHSLSDSYHVATLDHDAPTIFAGSLAFIQARSGTLSPSAPGESEP
jgi:carboxylesterase